MQSFSKFGFDCIREKVAQNTEIEAEKQLQMPIDDIFHAFPLKQEIVEEPKLKIKISNKFSLPTIKTKQEVIEAELEHLIYPNLLSKPKQELNELENLTSSVQNADNSVIENDSPIQNNVNLPEENEDLDTDYRQLDDYISLIPLPPEEPIQNSAIPLHLLYSYVPRSPPRSSPRVQTPPIEQSITTMVTTTENDCSFFPSIPQMTMTLVKYAELSKPTSSSSIESDSITPINSQREEQLPIRIRPSISEPVTSQLVETPIRPSWRQNPQRIHGQDEFQQPSEYLSCKTNILKRPRSFYFNNDTTNSDFNKDNNNNDSSSSISDFIYPPKDLEIMSTKSSPKIISKSTTNTPKSPPNFGYFNNNYNYQKNSSSSFSSIKTPQSSSSSFKQQNDDNNNFNLNNNKASSIGSGRFSFYTPKFNPLRYKNGWLFRNLCEKPGLKNPVIKKSPIKTSNNSFFNENNEGNDSIISDNADDDLRSNRIVPVIFSFNLSPIAPFFTNGYCFSNHYMVNYLKIDGILFCCTEQYYMFYKACVFNDKQAMSDIMRTRDPKHMKRIGSKVVGFDQSKWFKISIQVMAIATYYKYSLNRDLRLQLFETCGAEIIETNPTDKRWGIGLPMDDWRIRDKNEWKGLNILGRILTMCRDKLIENPKFSYDKDLIVKDIKESMNAANSVGCLLQRENK